MSRAPKLAYFWPGVSQFWGRDVRSGLIVAVGFSILLNLTLISTFVWSELLGTTYQRVAWFAISITWVGWAILAYTWDRRYGVTLASGVTDVLFGKAQNYYLESNWFEAERVLRKLLRHDRRDLDARFMLATLFRHTGRPREAEAELRRIERMEGAEKWALEISRERQVLAQLNGAAETADEADAETEPTPMGGSMENTELVERRKSA